MNDSPIYQDTSKITLQDITRRKSELKKDMRDREARMSKSVQDMYNPVSSAISATGSATKSIGTGIMLFEGVMMGIKIFRKIRKIFRRRK